MNQPLGSLRVPQLQIFEFLRCPAHPNTPQGYENLYHTIGWNLWVIGWIKTTMQRYRYPLSAAFYTELSASQSVKFIFVQSGEPYEIAVFEMPCL